MLTPSLRSTPLGLALVLLAAGAALAQTSPTLSVKESVTRAFEETDRNRDGGLDREEFHRRTVEVFYFLDRDRDGYVVIEDLREVRGEAFRAADRDRDGRLSVPEYLNARFKDFEAADANGDGAITPEELERWIQSQPR
jgi:Ca2+-binding EF-hand superfamily protein